MKRSLLAEEEHSEGDEEEGDGEDSLFSDIDDLQLPDDEKVIGVSAWRHFSVLPALICNLLWLSWLQAGIHARAGRQ